LSRFGPLRRPLDKVPDRRRFSTIDPTKPRNAPPSPDPPPFPKFLAKVPDYVATAVFCGATLQFLPQSGNFLHFFGPSARFWAKFLAKVPDYVATAPLLAGPFHFSASEWKFLHFLGPVLGPVARIWAQILTPADIFMSCTALAGSFGTSKCSFCLRVEIWAQFWAQCPLILGQRPECVATAPLLAGPFSFSASEWKFFALFLGPVPDFGRTADISGGICTSSVRFASHQCASPYKNTNPARAGHLLHVLTGSHRCPELHP
jgi:hypothetical protein